MAINKNSINNILKLFGFSEDEITELIDSDEEQDVAVPDGVRVFTADAYAQAEKAITKRVRGEAVTSGKEIAQKELKKAVGEFELEDGEDFAMGLKRHILAEANLPADEVKKSYDKKLQNLQQKLREAEQAALKEKEIGAAAVRNLTMLQKFPANRSKIMSDDDRMLLLQNKMSVTEEDGKPVYSYKGVRLTRENEEDMELDEALAHVFTQEKWIEEAGDPNDNPDPDKKGRGAHTQPRRVATGKPLKMSEAEKEWEKTGKNVSTADFQAHLLKLKKDNPDFDLDS